MFFSFNSFANYIFLDFLWYLTSQQVSKLSQETLCKLFLKLFFLFFKKCHDLFCHLRRIFYFAKESFISNKAFKDVHCGFVETCHLTLFLNKIPVYCFQFHYFHSHHHLTLRITQKKKNLLLAVDRSSSIS